MENKKYVVLTREVYDKLLMQLREIPFKYSAMSIDLLLRNVSDTSKYLEVCSKPKNSISESDTNELNKECE